MNILIAVGIAYVLQNKFTNKRTLKDHFISEVKEIRSEYRTFLTDLYSNTSSPRELLSWFKLMNIKVGDLISIVNQKYEIPENFFNSYQIELRELVTNSEDFERCFRSNRLNLSESTRRDLTRFQQEHQRLFNDLIIKINDSSN